MSLYSSVQPVVAGLVVSFSGLAVAGTSTSIPCMAKTKAVIANTGSSVHNSNSLVVGDVQAGQNIQQNGGIINGNKLANTPAGLAVVSPPAGATNLGALLVGSGQTRNLTAGNYVASSVTLNQNAKLTVSGGIVQVWVSGALVIGSGSSANTGGLPENLEFLVTGNQDAHVNSNGSLYGLIYAPNAPVLIDAPVHGSIVGSRTTLNSNGQVLYDASEVCAPVLPKDACTPGAALTVLLSGSDVTAYVPNGSWSEFSTGIKVARVEGSGPNASIATPDVTNACASNSVTGTVVCTANGTSVYVINGTAITNTLTSGATAGQGFSGGFAYNAGVAFDQVNNKAAIAVGLSGADIGGFQILDLTSMTFAAPIPAGNETTEGMLIDPVHKLLLSPNQDNVFQILNTQSSLLYSNSVVGGPAGGVFNSAAADCSTGIGLASVEFQNSLYLTNLAHVTYSGSNWSAPSQYQSFPEFAMFGSGTAGLAVAPGSHLAVVTGEFGGNGIGVVRLPATEVTGVPSALDYAAASIPNDPSGTAWDIGLDPHPVTAYQSPNSKRPFAVVGNFWRTYLAVVDLQSLLAAPRVLGTHDVRPDYDLIANGVVRFVQLP